MGNTALVIAFIIGVALFLAIITIAAFEYENAKTKMRSTKNNPNEWLFYNFYLKAYGALFERQDVDEVAVKLGIDVENYYKTCELVRQRPNTKKLIMNNIYGFACLIVSALFAVLWNWMAIIIGAVAYFALARYEQYVMDKKAEEMRLSIANDLPRFLDLLSTELKVGLPIEVAIYILCEKFDSLLSREFLGALNQMEIGASGWQQALEEVASKYDVETLSNFVLDVTTAYGKGVSVTDSVVRKTKEIKETHLLTVKERAGKTTNSILLPIAIFQFVPLLAFLLIPALTQALNGL